MRIENDHRLRAHFVVHSSAQNGFLEASSDRSDVDEGLLRPVRVGREQHQAVAARWQTETSTHIHSDHLRRLQRLRVFSESRGIVHNAPRLFARARFICPGDFDHISRAGQRGDREDGRVTFPRSRVQRVLRSRLWSCDNSRDLAGVCVQLEAFRQAGTHRASREPIDHRSDRYGIHRSNDGHFGSGQGHERGDGDGADQGMELVHPQLPCDRFYDSHINCFATVRSEPNGLVASIGEGSRGHKVGFVTVFHVLSEQQRSALLPVTLAGLQLEALRRLRRIHRGEQLHAVERDFSTLSIPSPTFYTLL